MSDRSGSEIYYVMAVSRQDAVASPAARAIEEAAVAVVRNLFGYAREKRVTLDPATLKLEVRLSEYNPATLSENYIVRATVEGAP